MSKLKVKDITKSYNEKMVLSKFSHEFQQGSKTAIMGVSGVGKTTLLRIIMGLEEPDCGEVLGVPESFSSVFQEDRLCEEFSAITNVKIALPKNTEYKVQDIKDHLIKSGLSGYMKVPVKTLSGGMKRRVAIVRAVMKNSPLLIMDEPFKGLDVDTKDDIISYILDNTKDTTVIMVTHSIDEAKALNAKIIEI